MKMKKVIYLIAIFAIPKFATAQNVGINNTNPQTTLDIKGGLSTRAKSVAPFANTFNIPTNESFVIVEVATDTVTAFWPAYLDGARVVILNNSGHYLQFNIGTDFILPNQSKEFICRNPGGWMMINIANNTSAGWNTSGNAGLDTTKFLGTTDSSMLLFKTQNFISGQVGNPNNNVSLGFKSLQKLKNTSAVYGTNTAIGDFSMAGREFGYNNTAIGFGSMVTNVANNNTAVGANAMLYSEVGYDNTAIGADALSLNNGGNNVAVGFGSMLNENYGANNVAIGAKTLYNSTNSNNSIAIGANALYNDTAANGIVAIGRAALYNNINKYSNLAIGDSSLFNNGSVATSGAQGNYNTAVGNRTLFANITGHENTAIGTLTLTKNIASGNTGVGSTVLFLNTTGNTNTAIGQTSMYSNVSGNSNVGVGYGSMAGNISGSNNVALGEIALAANKSGSGNIAIGSKALVSDTAANGTVAIGRASLYNNKNASNNIAIGDSALFKNSIGSIYSYHGDNNTALGTKAMLNNTTGNRNTATGANTLTNNTTGESNTVFGYFAMANNTTGSENTAIGNSALPYNIEGEHNVGVGQFALLFNNYIPRTDSSQAKYNVGVGSNTFRENYLGSNNTGVGNFAGMRVSGNKNTIIGANTKRLLADPIANINGSVFIGHNAGSTENASDKLYIENTATSKDSALIYGDFANDSLLLNGKVIIRNNAVVKGFTKLGGTATNIPAIKMKELTVTSASTALGMVSIAHGVTASKIIAVNVLLEWATNNFAPPEYSSDLGLRYSYFVNTNDINIQNNAINNLYIISKPVKILITYKE
jgi:trimeric autotransporter adhesin